MQSQGSDSVRDALRSMESGEASRAHPAVAALRDCRSAVPGAGALGAAFRTLLRRRGYFVDSEPEYAASLEEVFSVGEGFDLFDLARSLADFDAARLDGTGPSRQSLYPELARFRSAPHA